MYKSVNSSDVKRKKKKKRHLVLKDLYIYILMVDALCIYKASYQLSNRQLLINLIPISKVYSI